MKDLDLDKLRVHRQAGTASPATRRRRTRWPWLLLIAAAVGAGVWTQMPKTRTVQTSQVVSAWPSQQYELLSATGYVVAQRKTAVSAKGTGRLIWIGPSEGDQVKAGEVIARLESQDVEARHRASVANTAVAAAAVTTAQRRHHQSAAHPDAVRQEAGLAAQPAGRQLAAGARQG